jgi:hypothetical protein
VAFVARPNANNVSFTQRWVNCTSATLDAQRAHYVAQGWSVCGLNAGRDAALTLLLRREEAAPAAPMPVNDTSLLYGEPLANLPQALRSGHVFDLDELVQLIVDKGVFNKFYTNQPLSGGGYGGGYGCRCPFGGGRIWSGVRGVLSRKKMPAAQPPVPAGHGHTKPTIKRM